MASITGGGLTFAYNTFLRRELNLADLTDANAARIVLGLNGTLTAGSGLLSSGGAFGTNSANIVFSADMTSTPTANKLVQYDSSGNVHTANQLYLGASTFTRDATTNGGLQITNTGSGTFSLNNGTGTIQMVSGGPVQFTSATTVTSTSKNGTTINLTNDASAAHTALIVDASAGNTGSLGMSVVGGATIDALTVTGAMTGSTGAFSGALSGTTGTFTSDVSGVKGTFTGDVSGVKGAFTGAVSGTTGTFSGAVSGTTGTFSSTVSGTVATFSYVKQTAQPSFCIVTSADKSAASALLTSQTPSAEPLAAVGGFSYSGTATRGVTQTAHTAQVTFPTAGRYLFTLNASFSGYGTCSWYDGVAGGGGGALGTTSIMIYSNSTVSGTVNFSRTFIIDIAANDVFTLLITNSTTAAFTMYAGSTLTGYLIG